jgi:flagellar basal-body rod protein FlgF
MSNGFYTAAQAMLLQQRRLNTIANNIANVKTNGYKKEETIISSFQESLKYRIDEAGKTLIGSESKLQGIDEINFRFDPANLEDTNRSLDIALVSEGFFTVRLNNEILYTRDGSFNIDSEGYLVTSNGARVQGTKGDIRVLNDKFVVFESGIVKSSTGQVIDTLLIQAPNEQSNLIKMQNGYFAETTGNMGQITPWVIQSMLENSNVDVTEEMTRLIEVQRNFQSVANALKTIDGLNARAVSEIGKV